MHGGSLKHLLLALLLLVPVGLRADFITGGGYGAFYCGADTGFATEGQLSLIGQDGGGNSLDANLSFTSLATAGTGCSPSLPVVIGELDSVAGVFGDQVGGTWNYLEHTFTAGSNGTGYFSCTSDDAQNPNCGLLISLDENGDLTIGLGGEDSLGNPNYILEFQAQATPVYINSSGTQGYADEGLPEVASYATGAFEFSNVPEPAEWMLLLAAVPVLAIPLLRAAKKKAAARA